MRWTRRTRAAGVQVAFAICSSATAAPAEGSESEKTRFAILYEAPADCPTHTAFVEQVSVRVGAERIAESADEARTLQVVVRAQGAAFLGTLSVGRSVRTLRADTCAEAAKALALAAAIVIDPDLALGSRQAKEPDSPDGSTGPEVAEPAPLPKPVETRPEPPSPARPSPPLVAPDRPPSSRTAELWLSVGPSLEARTAIASEVTLALGAFVETELYSETLISPAFRLAGFVARTTEEVSLGSADVRLLAVRLEACPVKLSPSNSLDVQPCAAFELGERRIDARTAIASQSESETRLWAAPGAALRGGWSPVKPLRVELQAGAYVPLDRATVTFADSGTNERQVRSAPAIGVSFGAAVATRFSP
jgi:hypothetical protein